MSKDEDTIDSSHVVIENVVYNVDTPLKAFDVAFKAAHMFDVHYPRECDRELLFLQKAVYGFTTSHDKKISDKSSEPLAKEYENFKSK